MLVCMIGQMIRYDTKTKTKIICIDKMYDITVIICTQTTFPFTVTTLTKPNKPTHPTPATKKNATKSKH